MKWADRNVGGTTNSPIGGLYGWCDPTGEKTSQLVRDYVPLKEYLVERIPKDIGGTEHDIATVRWGKKWRIPTRAEWKELVERCKWTIDKQAGIEGYRVEGTNGNCIFLPFTGLRFGETVSNKDSGYYWTSEMVEHDRECAYYFYFNTEHPNDSINTRNYVYSGRAVRPVCDKEV